MGISVYSYKKYPRYAVFSAVVSVAITLFLTHLKGSSSPLFDNFLIEIATRSTAIWLPLFSGLIVFHLEREKQKQTPKTLEGTQRVSPSDFNQAVKGDGIGIPCIVNGQTELLKIPSDKERYHLMLAGDSGTGKTALLNHLLLQIRARGELAIVYDPSLQFWSRLGQPGDILLHPLYEGCPAWRIADEITNPLNATAVAKSFLPDSSHRDEDEDFFKWSPQTILQALLVRLKSEGKGTSELLQWLRNPEEIDRTVKSTEHAYLIDPEASEQRWGVLGSLSKIGNGLGLLPTTGTPFSFHNWSHQRTGWIFIGTRGEEERDALRPLISAWLDIALGKLMLREDERAPPTWVLVDELPTLKKLPKLQSAITEGRKYNLRFCLGFQGRSQLYHLYGATAEALLSTPATKIFLRTSDYDAATWCANTIGKPLQERSSQSYSESYAHLLQGVPRDSFNHQISRYTDFAVFPNAIQNLDDRTGYLRFSRYVVPIQFDYLDLPKINSLSAPPLRLPSSETRALPEPGVVSSEL